MYLKQSFLFGFMIYLQCQYETTMGKRVSYISTERATIVTYNKKYYENVTMNSFRYSRRDPIYYINLHVRSLFTGDDNVTVSFFFYQLQNNRYSRTFVDIHFGLCEVTSTINLLGSSIREALANRTCPFPPGDYHLRNMTIPYKSVPDSFPYKLGRLFCNVSLNYNGITTMLVQSYVDLEVKARNKP